MLVFRLKAQEEIDAGSGLFVDNRDHLYFVVKKPGQSEIRQLDLLTGECETLLTSGAGLFCRHAYRDNLIIEYWDKPATDMYKCYCVSTGKISDKVTTPNEYLCCMTSFSHYYILVTALPVAVVSVALLPVLHQSPIVGEEKGLGTVIVPDRGF